MSESDDFLAEADYDKHPAYFTADSQVGDTLTGVICEKPRVVRTTPIGGGEPEPKLVVAVRREDGEVFSLWIKKGALASAVAKAAKEASGSTSVAEGGTIQVKFTGLGEKQPGKSAPKLWAARYKPPAAPAVDQSDIFGDEDEEPF